MGFKEKDKVALVLNGGGMRTATIKEVESVKNGVVKLVDSELRYDDVSGREIDPAIPGWYAEIIVFEKEEFSD